MDNFKEEIIVKQGGKGLNTLFLALTYIFIVIFGVIGFMGLSSVMSMNFTLTSFIQLIIGAGVVWFLWRNKDNFNTEYEYTFTSGEMDFAKVMGGKRRRHLMTLRLNDAEALGLLDSQEYARYGSMPNMKTIDLTMNKDAQKQFVYFIREGNKHMLILECSDAMWEMIKKATPKFANMRVGR